MTTILIITDNLPDQINGVVTTFTNLARIGEAEGFRVVFLTPNDFFYADCPGYNEVKLSIPLKGATGIWTSNFTANSQLSLFAAPTITK